MPIECSSEKGAAGTANLADPLSVLTPIMRKKGVRCDTTTFHRAVNRAFHAAESKVYDDIHRAMWESLPLQFSLLAADCSRIGAPQGNDLRLLDIGCGTGLGSALLLQTPFGARIREVHLVDTSPEMVARAQKRITTFGVKLRTTVGEMRDVPADETFDIILACSVLHHIPNTPLFLDEVALRQNPSGVFLHLQDPNGDHKTSSFSRTRVEELRERGGPKRRSHLRRLHPKRVAGKLVRLLMGEKDYIAEANEVLIRDGVIAKPMTPSELWTVTDIHVEDGEGISLRVLLRHLGNKGYDLVQARSYGFFGVLQSQLPPDLAAREGELIAREVPDGSQLSASWVLTPKLGD